MHSVALRTGGPGPGSLSASLLLWRGRILGVPLLWKLFGANAIIVLGTAATAIGMHLEQPKMWLTMSAALLVTFIVNGALVYLALRPLAALEEACGPAFAARYASLKKAELAQSAERIFAGDFIEDIEVKKRALAWVPAEMRFAAPEADAPAADETPPWEEEYAPGDAEQPDEAASERKRDDPESSDGKPSGEIEEAA